MEFGKEYIKLFDTEEQYNEFRVSNEFLLPNVSYILENRKKIYNKKAKDQYLTFVAIESGTFKFSGNSIDYSIDSGETWTTLPSDTNTPMVESGNCIMWKASGLTPTSSIGIGIFSSSGRFNVEGNAMSLYYSDDFKKQTSLSGKDYAFKNLFSGCTTVVNAENMSLLATTLANNCYYNMFNSCTSLTTAPSLPATTLANNCYYNMFAGCRNLTTAPSLPATTLANSCYYQMFAGCRNLTTAPSLPATTLANSCYYQMFAQCTSLTTAPSLPATTLANYCYYQMFAQCTSLTTAPSLPATTLTSSCYNSMFQGCTSLTTAPSLPATTLANNCYYNMFYGCRNLTTAPSLPATTLASSCYNYMFYYCTSLTTAPSLPATTLVSGCYNYMFYGCRNLNYIKAMFTTTPSTSYMNNWVSGVASSGTFVKNSAATWTSSCGTSTYPCNWTVETASS